MRRLARSLFIIAAIAAAMPLAFADIYPSRPITLIVPYAAGGGVDAVARVLGDKLGEKLGQKVIILNITGAGGLIGTQRAVEAEPDGYTLSSCCREYDGCGQARAADERALRRAEGFRTDQPGRHRTASARRQEQSSGEQHRRVDDTAKS